MTQTARTLPHPVFQNPHRSPHRNEHHPPAQSLWERAGQTRQAVY